jgi:hypothetical protein
VPEMREVLAEAGVTAWAAVSVPWPQIDPLRPQPGPVHVKPVGPKTLRFADEQTIAGMAALLHAIHNHGWHDRSFADWGVLGIPRFLGRTVTASNITRSKTEPGFSISPHIIPNQCLHSLSGAVSVALGIHGPNFGVGGGPQAVAEGLTTGLSVLNENRLPGLWLIFTGFDPEPIPDTMGRPMNVPVAYAAALAIERDPRRHTLRLIRHGSSVDTSRSVKDLAQFLMRRRETLWQCEVVGLGTIDLTIPAS